MTFELWWRDGYRSSDELECEWIAREAWDAAIATERQRCREIVKEVASASSIIGIGVAKQIAEKIGE